MCGTVSSVTASLHKLSAGDGYTYLTRQVAAADSTELGQQSLADYYSAKGESPGRWRGQGMASLGEVTAGTVVTEDQMKALFGDGMHPAANEIQQRVIRAEIRGGATEKQAQERATKSAKLGAAFANYNEEPSEFIVRVTRAYRDFNKERGAARDAKIPDEERAAIRTRVGRETFEEMHGRAPLDARELSAHVARSSRPPRRPVAGYDVTFSPVKSVSTLWALAPREVAEQVEAAHQAAVEDAMDWVERRVSYTRRGRAGVRQVDIKGLLMAQFTHRDSRAGDPDLHTHVAVSNKVEALDGTWLALDGQPLHQALVSASERYNTRVEAELVDRLGVSFVERKDPARGEKRAVREIDGVDPSLMSVWSSRRADIDARRAELATEFTAQHGRPPTPKEAIALAQQATLDTREAKHEPRSMAEQRDQWRQQADAHFEAKGAPFGVETMLATVRSTLAPKGRKLTRAERNDLAASALRTVEGSRAQWQMVHIRAEVERRIRAAGVSRSALDDHVEDCVDRALSPSRSVAINPQRSGLDTPSELQRRDGSSQYSRANSTLYTSERVIAAEESILSAARRTDARRIGKDQVSIALLEAAANGTTLDPGQAALVTEMSTSGARVQLGLAPAGSGKTTAMRALAHAWQGTGGHVIGLAPSAAASAELGSAIGTDADTLAKLVWHIKDPKGMPRWMRDIDDRSLVIIDEAGMAATPDLAAAIDYITSRGGSVRLVGDDQQLSAVGAGGVLRDIAAEVGAVHLTRLHRFADPAEGEATLALRDGRTEALGYYLDQRRVHASADDQSVAHEVFEAWKADTEAGRDALMMAATNETVTSLNGLARAHRIGGEHVGASVALSASGLRASAGDRLITRKNDRRLRITASHWVKNGDRFTVESVHDDGALTVRHDDTNRVLTLPAPYVAESVDLGYATTYHGAQGSTVDVTHCALTGAESRQLLYVGMSRGRAANHAYVPVSGEGDPHSTIHPDVVTPPTAIDVLEAIIRRDGAPRSARTEIRDHHDPTLQLRGAVDRYCDAVNLAAEVELGPDRVAQLRTDAETVYPGVSESPAWETLLGHLCRIETTGEGAAIASLRKAVGARELGTARDVAAVLDWRLDPSTAHGGKQGPLPWLPASIAVSRPEWTAYLKALTEEVEQTAEDVVQAASALDDAPAWADGLDVSLRSDLTVWRAACGVSDDVHSPTGPERLSIREKRHQRDLDARVQAQRAPKSSATSWRDMVSIKSVVDDPYWPVLAARLDAAALDGVDVHRLISSALDRGPLPDEHAAAALTSRITAALAPDSAEAQRLRPTWSPALVSALGETHAATVFADARWRDIVALLEEGEINGHDPSAVVRSAVSMIDLERVGTVEGIPHQALGTVLMSRMREVIDLDTWDQEQEEPPPEDPADFYDPEWTATQPPPDDVVPDNVDPEIFDVDPEPPLDVEYEEAEPATAPERLRELTAAAARFYGREFEGSQAQTYLTSRTGEADLSAYTLGYAPAGWATLSDHLREHLAATDAEMVDAGLAKWSRRGTLYDVFRDRLLFGLHDTNGHLVGFVGRSSPGSDDGPKYLNTPETAIFHKRAVMFGLTEGRDALAKGAVPVRVEGTMDAIAITAASNGRAVGVAPLGTALSEVQANQLAAAAGVARQVVVAADADSAGAKAAERDYWALVERGITPLALPVPGADPADVWESNPETLRAVCALASDSPPLASAVIEHRLEGHGDLDEGWVHARVNAARAIAPVIASTPVSDWRHHVRMGAEQLGDTDSEQMLWTEVFAAALSWNPKVDDPALEVRAERVSDARRELAALAADLGLDGDDETTQRPRDAIAALSEVLDEQDARLEESRRRAQEAREEDPQERAPRKSGRQNDDRRDDPARLTPKGPRR